MTKTRSTRTRIRTNFQGQEQDPQGKGQGPDPQGQGQGPDPQGQ